MDTYEAIITRRTIRLFEQRPIPKDILIKILEAARLAPSAMNKQPLEYIVVTKPENREKLFKSLAWAGYVQQKRTPPEGKRPVAYIIVLARDKELNLRNISDASAAMENMILAAWNEGIGSCWICSVQRDTVKRDFNIPDGYVVYGVLALGYPGERPVIEEAKDSESTVYWVDENDVLHIPKRRLKDILHYEDFSCKEDQEG